MNPFGIDLKGKTVVYSKRRFYKKDTPQSERLFICDSGPGCTAEGTARLGDLFSRSTLCGRWKSDGLREIIDSRELESYQDKSGKFIPRPKDMGETIDRIADIVVDPQTNPKKEK